MTEHQIILEAAKCLLIFISCALLIIGFIDYNLNRLRLKRLKQCNWGACTQRAALIVQIGDHVEHRFCMEHLSALRHNLRELA